MTVLDPQILAADPKRSVFVTANAGSGKTTTLVNRVARLLLNGVEPGEILCVTYTKAAAAEMQARLFGQLGRWAVLDDAELSGALAALDGSDPAVLDHGALGRARRLFARALETPGGLKIQTIHAFCEKLLRRFPIEAGVAPNFTVLENEAARVLSRAARDDLARAALKDREGPIGDAYAHFAVALDWKRFEALLALIEADRDKLAAYVEAMEAGEAPRPTCWSAPIPTCPRSSWRPPSSTALTAATGPKPRRPWRQARPTIRPAPTACAPPLTAGPSVRWAQSS